MAAMDTSSTPIRNTTTAVRQGSRQLDAGGEDAQHLFSDPGMQASLLGTQPTRKLPQSTTGGASPPTKAQTLGSCFSSLLPPGPPSVNKMKPHPLTP
mmetsp:Transcript_105252/g.181505  ORF Transcript_105252/g.181505 Transcript_105252/m.181505 type:complete len:97 (+) Transcript_105252:945-1235(+)